MKDQLDAQPGTSAKWPVRPLGKVTKFLGGGTPSKSRADFWNGDIPWVSPKDMKSDVVSDSLDKITPQAVAGSAAKTIPADSLLIVVRSGILARTVPTALSGRELTINQDLKAICPSQELHPRFLAYFMRASESQVLATVSRGATVHRLSTEVLKSLEIPLPPLEEQKRIVAVLDQALAALDRARAHAEANAADTRELRERGIGRVFASAEAEGWNVAALKEIADLNYGYTEKAQADPVGPKFLRITDIQDGDVDWSTVPYCRADQDAITKYSVEAGDIVFARTGATTGKSYLISSPPRAVCASYLIRLRIKKGRLSPEFLSYYFQSDQYWDEVRRGISGSTQGGFNASKLGEMIVPVPPPERQKELVEKFNRIERDARSAEMKYREKLDSLSDLRQSLLHEAFSGHLA